MWSLSSQWNCESPVHFTRRVSNKPHCLITVQPSNWTQYEIKFKLLWCLDSFSVFFNVCLFSFCSVLLLYTLQEVLPSTGLYCSYSLVYRDLAISRWRHCKHQNSNHYMSQDLLTSNCLHGSGKKNQRSVALGINRASSLVPDQLFFIWVEITSKKKLWGIYSILYLLLEEVNFHSWSTLYVRLRWGRGKMVQL